MNSLLIKGIQKTSLIDYPDKVAATIFVGKCNFRCPFCHNSDLVLGYDKLPTIKENEILEYLKNKKKWLDAICITGGEPLIHKELIDFIKKVKNINMLVKIDTNGSNPAMLKKLIKEKLVDYIAMDIKTSLGRYDKAAGVKVDKNKLKQSINIIKNSKIDYEFRLTAVPGLINGKDVSLISNLLKGSKRFFIQQFRPDKKVIDKAYINKKPFSKEELEEFKKILNNNIKEVKIRI